MSQVVDSKIVEMRFDSKQFVSGAQEALKSLGQLKEGLKLTEATKGINSLNDAVKKTSFNGLADGIDNVKFKMSAMNAMAIDALLGIERQAIQTGKKVISALTIDPVKTGFQEYETQIKAVQTILANTKDEGTTIEEVNAVLDELNKYADQTVYNFTEMANNIGTFTAAGVDLHTSASAIKGIANLAAMVGANATDATRAMYQLSQALAAGSVHTIDWNSVVNAKMGGEVFRNAILETAAKSEDDNTLRVVRQIREGEISFRESLNAKEYGDWLTSDVLLESLEKFTGDLTDEQLLEMGYTEQQIEQIKELGQTANDAATKVKTFTQLVSTLEEAAQSGWTQTWELLIGDFEEAKELYTQISDRLSGYIGEAADNRNKFVEEAFRTPLSHIDFSDITKDFTEDSWWLVNKSLEETAALYGKKLPKMIKSQEDLDEVLESGVISAEMYKEAMNDLLSENRGKKPIALGQLESVLGIVKDLVNGEYGLDNADWLTALTENGISEEDAEIAIEYANTLNRISDAYGGITEESLRAAAAYLSQRDSVKGYSDEELKASGVSESSIESVNALAEKSSKYWQDARDLIIESLLNIDSFIYKIRQTAQKAWSIIFPSQESIDLIQLTILNFNDFSKKINEIDDTTLRKLYAVFKGLFSLVDIGVKFISALWNGFKQLVGTVISASDGLLDVAVSFSRFLVLLDKAIEKTDIFNVAIGIIVDVLSTGILLIINIIKSAYPAIKAVAGVFADIFLAFSDSVVNLAPIVRKFFDSFNESFSFEPIKILSEMFDSIAEKISTLREESDSLGELIVGTIKAIVSTIVGSGLFKLANWLLDLIEKTFGVFGSSLGSIFRGLGAVLAELKLGKVIEFIQLLATLKFASAFNTFSKSINGILKSIKGITDGASKVVNNFAGILKKIQDTLETFQKKVKAEIIQKIAISLAILVASMFALTLLDREELIVSLLTVVTLITTLVISMKALGSITGDATFTGKLGKQFTSLAVTLLILAVAMKAIANIGLDRLIPSLLSIGTLLLMIAGFVKLLDSGSMENVKGARSLIVVALVIHQFVKEIAELAAFDVSELAKGIIGIGALLTEMVLFTKYIEEKQLVGVSIGISALSISLLMLSEVVGKLGSLNIGELAKGLVGIGVLLLELTLFANKIDNEELANIGVGIGVISLGLELLADVVAKLGALSFWELIKGLIGLAATLAIVTITVSNMSENIETVAPPFLILSGALVILAEAIKRIADIGLGNLIVAIASLGLILAELSIGLNMMNGALGGVAVLFSVSAALLVLAPAIFVFSKIPLKDILTSLGYLAGVFALLGVVGAVLAPLAPIILALSNALMFAGVGLIALSLACGLIVKVGEPFINTLKKMLISIIEFLPDIIKAIVKARVDIIKSFADGIVESADTIKNAFTTLIQISFNSLKDNIPIIVDCLEVFLSEVVPLFVTILQKHLPAIVEGGLTFIASAINSISKHVPDIVNDLLNFIVKLLEAAVKHVPNLIDSGMELFSTIFKTISDRLKNVGIDSIEGVLKATGAMALIIVTLSGLKYFIPGAMKSIAELALLVAELGVIFTIFGLFARIANTSLIEAGGELGEKIGVAIGKFIGGIIGGIADGATDSLPEVGNNLTAFMMAAQPFFDSVANMGTDVYSSMFDLINAVTELTSGAMKKSILSVIAGSVSLNQFGSDLASLARGLVKYAEIIEEAHFNENKVVASKILVGILSSLSSENIPKTGGILHLFTGENDITKFSEQLPSLAEGLNGYAKEINTTYFNSKKIEASKYLISILADLASHSIPASGGVLQWLMGEKDLSVFGNQLPVLAQNLSKYAKTVNHTTFNDEKTKASVAMATMLGGLAKNDIPSTGGVIQFLIGEKDLGVFGGQLPTLAEGLAVYAKKIDGSVFNDSKIKASGSLISMLGTIAQEKLPKTGGLLQWIVGVEDLSNFGAQLPKLAEGISGFAEGISSEITSDKTDAAQNAADMLATLQEKVGKMDNGNFIMSGDLEKFGANIKSFGWYVNEYFEAIEEIDSTQMTSVTSAVVDTVEKLNNLTVQNPDILNEVSSIFDNIGQLNINAVSDNFQKTITDLPVLVSSFLSTLSAEFSDDTTVDSAVQTLLSDSINHATTVTSESYTNSGNFLINLLLNAVQNKQVEFSTAIAEILAAIDTTLEENKEHMYTKAYGFAYQFVSGFKDSIAKVKEVLSEMVTEITDYLGVQETIDKFVTVGKYAAEGYANGIQQGMQQAYDAGAGLGNSSVTGTSESTDTNSPSRVFEALGRFNVLGYINGMLGFSDKVYSVGSGLGETAINGLRSTISTVSDTINSMVSTDMDLSPTITPVVDTSVAEYSLSQFDNRLSGLQRSVSTLGVGVDLSGPNLNNQNGFTNEDVVDAINKLGSTFKSGDTVTINGVTYDDGSNIVSAVKQIVRAARIERRA